MKQIINSTYSRLFFAGLALTIICAWFSMGSLFYDEHYQVLEFCSYKLGNAVPNSYSLPWEFYDRLRSTLLPGIAYVIAKIMEWCHIYDPFTLAFLLRLITGISAWFITCRLCIYFLPKLKSANGGRLLILMSLFLWFVPFLNVRYTPENISGILLLYGVYSILSAGEKTPGMLLRYGVAGLLFGISFFIRIQMIFALAGFAAWLIRVNKIKFKYLFVLILSAGIAIGLNVLVDYWFYGEWTFTPYNYFYKNIVQHVAAGLSSNPWWFYFTEFLSNAFPPLSWLLLIMFVIGLYKNLKDPFIWIMIHFLIGHCIIAHKEFRFLFPVTFIFIYITALGFDYLLYGQPRPKGKKISVKNNPVKSFYQKIHTYVFVVAAIICVPLLIIRTLAPLQFSMYDNKFLYNHLPEKNTPLFYIPNRTIDMFYNLNTSFYKNPGYATVLVDSIPQIFDYLRNHNTHTAFLFTKLSFSVSGPVKNDEDLVWNGYKIRTAYCFFPSWMLNNDIGNWEKETPVFRIYRFTPVDSNNGFDANKLIQDPNSFRNPYVLNSILSWAYNSLETGRLAEAEKVLTAVDENTRNIAVPHLHNYSGMLYLKENKVNDAKKEFNTEIALNTQKEEAFLNLGMIYFKEKDYDSAVTCMNSVLQINPANVDALNNIGVYLLYFKKDYTGAITCFSKVLNLDLDYLQGYINFTVCARHFNADQVSTNYQRILLDDRDDRYAWVVVKKGMSGNELKAAGIDIPDETMRKINGML